MELTDLLERVRELIQKKMQIHGATLDPPPTESILIRDGFFCGRRFTSAQIHAVWFHEENQVKFHRQDGTMIEAVDLDQCRWEDEDQRAA